MSMNYLIYMNVKVKDGQESDLIATLKENRFGEDYLYDNLDEAIKIALDGYHPETDFRVCDDGTVVSEFDHDFSYESSLIHFFKDIAPYLKDGSYMEMFPDNAYSKHLIMDGIIEDYAEQDQINWCFCSGEELYEMAAYDDRGYYNKKTGYYVAKYSESGDIIVYNLAKSLARECAKFARENDETWLANLGPGGQIISEENAPEFIEGILKEGTEEDWILASPVADMFGLKPEAEDM